MKKYFFILALTTYFCKSSKLFLRDPTHKVNVQSNAFNDSQIVYSTDGPRTYYTLETPKLPGNSMQDIEWTINNTHWFVYTRDEAKTEFHVDIKLLDPIVTETSKDVNLEELPGEKFSVNLILIVTFGKRKDTDYVIAPKPVRVEKTPIVEPPKPEKKKRKQDQSQYDSQGGSAPGSPQYNSGSPSAPKPVPEDFNPAQIPGPPPIPYFDQYNMQMQKLMRHPEKFQDLLSGVSKFQPSIQKDGSKFSGLPLPVKIGLAGFSTSIMPLISVAASAAAANLNADNKPPAPPKEEEEEEEEEEEKPEEDELDQQRKKENEEEQKRKKSKQKTQLSTQYNWIPVNNR